MKLLKFAALLALAAVPLWLLSRQRKARASSVDSDDIFDAGLRGD